MPYPDSRDELIAAVAALIAETGEPPSAAAVAKRLGVTRIAARRRLKEAEALGLLEDVPRTISSGKWRLSHVSKMRF